MNDLFEFAEDESEVLGNIPEKKLKPWRILIVDDEPAIHDVTLLALKNFSFEGRGLEFIHCYSEKEAREKLPSLTDVSLVLLDVVMESDESGLKLVHFIREDCNNHFIRIVLRTGQPGQAPESEVIEKYDINDYKEKTELTTTKLATLLYSCLRSWRDIVALNESRQGLENVIKASQQIFSQDSIEVFAEGVIQQLTSLLNISEDAAFGKIDSLVTHENQTGIRFLAGTGAFAHHRGEVQLDEVPKEWLDIFEESRKSVESVSTETHFLAQLTSHTNERSVLMLSGIGPKSDLERNVLELFCQNALVAFDNLLLRLEIEETQRELVYRLGEAVETRSRETGNHVKRVAEISKLLSLKVGQSPRQAEILKYASPMHDLGKIGIPDDILNKPGKLEPDEWAVMQTHAQIGMDMLGDSEREILQLGGLISLEHHEKWDGSGYPHGKAGEEIALESRITAIADVYDALASDRCYKKAWPLDQVVDFFHDQKGKHFDPNLVEILMDNIGLVDEIRERYQDDF